MEHNQNTQGLYDIYDVSYTPLWRTTPFYVAVALLAVGLLVLTLWIYLKKRRARAITPWAEASSQLELLMKKGGTDNARFFYVTMTAILKNYLERRYDFKLREKTDEEVVIFLEHSSLEDLVRDPLQKIFTRAVACKFGKLHESVEQMVLDAQVAHDIIKRTVPHNKNGN